MGIKYDLLFYRFVAIYERFDAGVRTTTGLIAHFIAPFLALTDEDRFSELSLFYIYISTQIYIVIFQIGAFIIKNQQKVVVIRGHMLYFVEGKIIF